MKLEISTAVHDLQSLVDQHHQQIEQLDVDAVTCWTGLCVPKSQSLLTPPALQDLSLWKDQDNNEIFLFSSPQHPCASFARQHVSLHDGSPGNLIC